MQATNSNVFALKKSGLDVFLYADVGAETNGSTLTILSVLARLGKDPWAEAARWAALPKAAVIDSLAQMIGKMPLAPAALADARNSAARLVQLLPTNPQSPRQGSGAKSAAATPNLTPTMMLYLALAVGMALNLLLIPQASPNVPASNVQSTTTTPEAIHPATGPLPTGAAVAGSPSPPARQSTRLLP